jgi:serine/threonine-protein kinase RsbW
MLERRFPRAVGSLDAIFSFVHDFLAARGLDPELAFDLDLIAEELFTNQVKWGRADGPDILLGLDADAERVTLVVRDFDAERFDPTSAAPLDVGAPLEERRPGGLGIHLVRRIAEEVRYSYEDRVSTITVTKRL